MSAKRCEWIYLLASNATKEYILDALETLALPRGSIQHFRYQSKYVDPELVKRLPVRSERRGSDVLGSQVLACYLYQERLTVSGEQWQWIAIYPLRRGVLVDAYKTGTKPTDVAHFYFEVRDYYDYKTSFEILQSAVKECVGKECLEKRRYASLGEAFRITTADSAEDESAFHSFTEAMDPQHLRTPGPDEQRQYYPAFCFIRGLRSIENSKLPLEPSYHEASHKSFYELKEGSAYTFELSYYFPRTPPDPTSEISLRYDTKLFTSPPYRPVRVASRYDEEAWLIIPRTVQRESWSTLELQTNIKAPSNLPADILNLERSFPLRIKSRRRWKLIVFDILGDLGLAIGTVSLALSSQITYWVPLTIAGYALWALLKFASRVLKV